MPLLGIKLLCSFFFGQSLQGRVCTFLFIYTSEIAAEPSRDSQGHEISLCEILQWMESSFVLPLVWFRLFSNMTQSLFFLCTRVPVHSRMYPWCRCYVKVKSLFSVLCHTTGSRNKSCFLPAFGGTTEEWNSVCRTHFLTCVALKQQDCPTDAAPNSSIPSFSHTCEHTCPWQRQAF